MYSVVHHHFETLPSTALYAKEYLDQFDVNQLTLITADTQTEGKGQHSRKWDSPEGNLFATYVFTVPLGWDPVIHAAQLLSWSAAQVLIDLGLSPNFKWPNDLLVGGKKIAGILCETVKLDGYLRVIDSIGLNVNTPIEVDQPTTSLVQEIGGQDLPKILEALNQQFYDDLTVFLEEGFSPFVQPFDEMLLEVRDND